MDIDAESDSGDNINEITAKSAEAELSKFKLLEYLFQKYSIDNMLEQLSKEWNLLIYVFFKPTPLIEYIKGRCVHVFECSAKHCKGKGNGHMVHRYLDTSDAKSTSNLRKHARVC